MRCAAGKATLILLYLPTIDRVFYYRVEPYKHNNYMAMIIIYVNIIMS